MEWTSKGSIHLKCKIDNLCQISLVGVVASCFICNTLYRTKLIFEILSSDYFLNFRHKSHHISAVKVVATD